MIYKVLLLICIIVIVFLYKTLLSMNKKLNQIKIILDDILSGHTDRRIMLNNNLKSISHLVNNINQLVENVCKIDNEKNKQSIIIKKMISNISHDLKTPLTSLVGYIELIKENKNLSEKEVREYLDIAHNKACFLNTTLDNFFYLSRLESNDEKFTLEKINLSDMVKEQILFFYNDFLSLSLEPSIDIPEDDIFVLADKLSVSRILNNLLSNSLKYGRDGDKVGISLKIKDFYIYIQVWDNGKGISEKDLSLIFDRLYTVENSRNTKLSGTGIGLSIVKQLVKKNKGTIIVDSIPFTKTSFIFTLVKAS
ncbi:sensor histidine kinase [Clostridium estertheticum]|uniref:sensor histidine kinase n=1 Tax=Clostridium estertheticum TaxID=238834 RepID=UPI001CF1A513|nr:HAMP domain-containing sensor histidine kinase [Clostridium estertheticum]MCB2342515.1 HAMP domain-containing histidine kinase [Clostridium estertheticum]